MSSTEKALARHEAIPISDVRDALQKEWGDLSEDVESKTGHPPLRANTSTLVVIADKGREAARARETLHQLASSIPSRVIVFILDEECERATASVWAHCTLSSRGRHGGCYDVIEISLPPDRLRAAPNIVSVHRLGGLPTILIWVGPVAFQAQETGAIAAVSDYLVVDTEAFDDPITAIHEYANFLHERGQRLGGSDLSWTRTSTWRELIAQSFDPPGMRPFVTSIRSVDIAYDDSQSAGAFLIGSWLVSRLGSSPDSVTRAGRAIELHTKTSSSGRGPTIRLQPSYQAGRGIRSVRIVARSGTDSARISIVRGANAMSTVRVRSPGMPLQERVVAHHRAPRTELIAAELMQHQGNRAYHQALESAAKFYELSRGGNF